MTEKTRKKKGVEDMNKNNQRTREVDRDAGKKNAATARQDKAGSGQGKD